jgi:hypothetical protein
MDFETLVRREGCYPDANMVIAKQAGGGTLVF